MEYKNESTYKGTRILTGEEAKRKRQLLNDFSMLASLDGFEEVFLPTIEHSVLYTNKAGKEIIDQMFVFQDKSFRRLCLRPEGTATIQMMADTFYKYQRDIKMFYTIECFRYERPQAGRYRQFTQFGVEWINPRNPEYALAECQELAFHMMKSLDVEFQYNNSVKRGLSYYTGPGFEFQCPSLGAQKQVCGGGAYKEGVGFAFGIDRLLCLPSN